jgi:hypothetical protein
MLKSGKRNTFVTSPKAANSRLFCVQESSGRNFRGFRPSVAAAVIWALVLGGICAAAANGYEGLVTDAALRDRA